MHIFYQCTVNYIVIFAVVIALLDSQYDKCFCEECATKRGDLKASNMGNPKQKFAVPWGYAKFGVK